MKDNQTKKRIITKISIGINVTTLLIFLYTILYTGFTRRTIELGFGSDGFVGRINSASQVNYNSFSADHSKFENVERVGNDNSVNGNSGGVNSNNGNVYHNNGDGNQNGSNNSIKK